MRATRIVRTWCHSALQISSKFQRNWSNNTWEVTRNSWYYLWFMPVASLSNASNSPHPPYGSYSNLFWILLWSVVETSLHVYRRARVSKQFSCPKPLHVPFLAFLTIQWMHAFAHGFMVLFCFVLSRKFMNYLLSYRFFSPKLLIHWREA